VTWLLLVFLPVLLYLFRLLLLDIQLVWVKIYSVISEGGENMKKFIAFLSDFKSVFSLAFAFGIMTIFGLDAHAAGFSDVQTSVTSTMGDLKDAALSVLGAIAGVAILLFGGIYIWRYGKKVFSIISK
jgi:hypothetical protein